MKDSLKLTETLKSLIAKERYGTQEELSEKLKEQLGYQVNQSTISRLLRKLKALKINNDLGKSVYALPKDPSPPKVSPALQELVLDIVANEYMIVIFTSPGSASMLARILDHKQSQSEILGTIAGDDTIFVVPKSINHISQLHSKLKTLFDFH